MSTQKHHLQSNTFEIEKSSQDLKETVDHQSASFERTAAALEQIYAMIRHTTANIELLDKNAQLSQQSVDKGRSTIQKLRLEMNEINQANQKIGEQMNLNSEQLKRVVGIIEGIGDKTQVINEIVMQTKLLSFNASVEAARAGEHGKGFAVVAMEIAQLAQMSGKAAVEISELIDQGCRQVTEVASSSQQKVSGVIRDCLEIVERGQSATLEVDQAFTQISEHSHTIKTLTGEVANSIREETTGVAEINNSIQDFNRSTKTIAESASSSTALVDEFKVQFDAFEGAMNDLNRMIGGRRTA